ncbi:MAG: Nif3-like dinuclear metal center hexameric protein [Desulfovibrio sp.]|jgi:dinuclear metal center YbgI/SA1388 family protein|nr:Nif3-like dinuclear metal center hexameric protein [Desulfovibrio sp.]
MDVSEIIAVIEQYAPPAAAASWDVSGVQTASFTERVNLAAVALEPSAETVGAAAEAGAGFILTHHPLSMQPRFPNRRDSYLTVLSLLLARGITLYSAHTTLDANPSGPVRTLARDLDLRDTEILDPTNTGANGQGSFGFGFVGNLPHVMPWAEFNRMLRATLGRFQARICGRTPEAVSRIACCPGSGASLAAAAAQAGADLFITGDLKYHSALEASDMGLCVLDVGHFILEEQMMRNFAGLLARELRVPVRFFPGRDPFARPESTVMHDT